MKFRRLGSTQLKVSVIGIGTWQLGGEWAKTFTNQEVDEMFNAAREEGMNLIDTAECYGDHSSEAFIGHSIKQDRDKWVVATKFGHKFHRPFERTEPRTAADVVEQLEGSLKALRTDYVDLLQYHSWGDAQFDQDDVRETLLKLKVQGKVRHIGNSIGSNDNLYQVDQSKRYEVEAIQLIYNRIDTKPEERVFASCQKQDLGVLARVPLASGVLSGRYKPGHQFKPDEVRSRWNRERLDEQMARAQQIRQNEVPSGVDMAQWALAWCLRHPAVTCVIPGCKDVEQLRHNAMAVALVEDADHHPQAAAPD